MRRIGAALVATVALALLFTQPAAPQPADREQLRLASKTAWVAPGGELVLRLMAEAVDRDSTELAVSVHGRVTSRSEFARTLQTPPRGAPVSVVAQGLSQLAPDAAGAFTVRLPVQDPSQPRDPARLFLGREGVYPVRVELRELGGGDVLTGFTTHLVNVGNPGSNQPLGAALVLPIHAPPTTKNDGSRGTPALDPLRQLASSLATHRDVGLSVQPTPETIEALADGGPEANEVLADLRAGLEGREVLGSTYTAIDPAVLVASGLGDELTAQRIRGARILRDQLAVRPDPRTLLVRGALSPAMLREARAAQVDRVITAEASLTPADLSITLAQPFSLAPSPRSAATFPALSIDADLSAHFTDEQSDESPDPVLAAHHLLADLAVVHYDSPAAERVVVVAPELDWVPDRAFLDALLPGLANGPLVRPVSLDEAFEVEPAPGARRGTQLVREPAETEIDLIPAAPITRARATLSSFAAVVDPANPIALDLERALLSAQAKGVPNARRRTLTEVVRSGIDAEFSKISLPENRSITLTARTGEIPVTIQSSLGYPVRARLRVESDKLAFPSGSRREIELANTNTTERFSIRARTSGAFPLRVVLESPDGELVLGRSLFTVRSTAASGVGVALSAGAGGFLAVWWARHVVQSRRSKRSAGTPA